MERESHRSIYVDYRPRPAMNRRGCDQRKTEKSKEKNIETRTRERERRGKERGGKTVTAVQNDNKCEIGLLVLLV